MKVQKKILYSINSLLLIFVIIFASVSVFFINQKINFNLINKNKEIIQQINENYNLKYQTRFEHLDFLIHTDKLNKFIFSTGYTHFSIAQFDLIEYINHIKKENYSFKEYFIFNNDFQPIFDHTNDIFYKLSSDLDYFENILKKLEFSHTNSFLDIHEFSFGKRIVYIKKYKERFIVVTEEFNFINSFNKIIKNDDSSILLINDKTIIEKDFNNFKIKDIDNVKNIIEKFDFNDNYNFKSIRIGIDCYYVFYEKSKYNLNIVKILKHTFFNKDFVQSILLLLFFIISLILIIWYSIFNSIKKFIVEKIDILKIASLNISKGKYDTQVKTKDVKEENDEIIDLAATFNEMAKNILQSTEKIQRIAYFDHLTQLPNKKSFDKHIHEISKISEFDDSQIACFLIDLDDFKSVNDIFGHEKGDLFLIEIGKKLEKMCNEIDNKYSLEGLYKVYRISGDDFIISIVSPYIFNKLEIISQEIVKSICTKLEVNNDVITPYASIGVSCYPQHTPLLDKLFQYSDIAMYHAKDKGKNQYSVINDDILNQRKEKEIMDKDIKDALANNDFILHFQPKYNISKDKFNHFEALIRWPHKEKGWISPAKFIPYAEKSCLILNIGDWVIATVCKHVKILEQAGYDDFKISFNVSSQQMKDKEFYNKLKEQVDIYNINPIHLEMEITEYTSVEDIENTLIQLKKVREIGISVSLDDFGKDYSSLSYLQNLPLDVLKIDKTFVSSSVNQNQEKSIKGQAIIKTIITLAQGLGLKTVAEGVEIKEEYELLKSLGCDFVQGWYFYKALDFKDIIKLLDKK